MRIYAFQGIRYSDHDAAGSWAGPPYDQIDDDLQSQLHQEPRHFAHLIRPAGATGEAHQAATELHRQWLNKKVLTRERGPALYPYEIRLAKGGRRLGICALVGLEDADSGIIRPHETTVAKTVDERLSLLRKMRIDLEPILMLADDQGDLDRLLEEDLQGSQTLVQHEDADGNHHRLYLLEDTARISVYQQTLSHSVGLIADGHHRYTVASKYAAESHAETGSPAATKLAVITGLSAPGLQIDPIHRRLERPLDLESVAHWASSCRPIADPSGVQIAAVVAAGSQPSIGVSFGGRTELWSFDPERSPDSLPEHLRHLSVGWLHDVLLPEMGLDSAAATDGTVGYRSDPDRLHRELQEGSAAMGFWLPPMSGESFARAMKGGSLLPPKSTRFLPKVASGLVWVGHDTPVA